MPRRPAARRRLDVYLLPAVIGSGLGDVAEVHSAGRWLSAGGFPPRLVRRGGHPWPRGLPGPFDWPNDTGPPDPHAPRALTISSQFGVTCAPGRDEPLGRAGEWALEVESLEQQYGPDDVLHVSLEEFGRTPTSREQVDERDREGGVPSRVRAARGRSRSMRSRAREAHGLYRKFRAFDRPNLLTLFPTFSPVAAFTREFPEALQVGPVPPFGLRPLRPRRRKGLRVLWYASPSSSERLTDGIRTALAKAGAGASLTVRSSRGLAVAPTPGVRFAQLRETDSVAWEQAWDEADLAIVSGSRTLLEAIARHVPFLYFNGVVGRGRSTRRHRPEKLDALLREAGPNGIPPDLRRDLRDFARARRVEAVVSARLQHARTFVPIAPARGFPPGLANGGELLVEIARAFARDRTRPASEHAARWRAEGARGRTPRSNH